MADANQNAKEHHKAISADSLQDWAEFAAPRTFGLAVRAYAGLRLAEKHPVVHNLVISNVPGPPVPLYFMGARIEALYPLGPVFHGAGLNITVMSNNGRVDVGIIACRESMPDVDDLARRFPAELARLQKAVQGRQEVTPITKAKGRAEDDRRARQAVESRCSRARKSRRRALTVATASTNAGTNSRTQHAGRVAGVDVVDGGAGDPAGQRDLAGRRDHLVAGG